MSSFESLLKQLSSDNAERTERIFGKSLRRGLPEYREVYLDRLPQHIALIIYNKALAMDDGMDRTYNSLQEFRNSVQQVAQSLGLTTTEPTKPKNHFNGTDIIWAWPIYIPHETPDEDLQTVLDDYPYFNQNPIFYIPAHETDVFPDEEPYDLRLLD